MMIQTFNTRGHHPVVGRGRNGCEGVGLNSRHSLIPSSSSSTHSLYVVCVWLQSLTFDYVLCKAHPECSTTKQKERGLPTRCVWVDVDLVSSSCDVLNPIDVFACNLSNTSAHYSLEMWFFFFGYSFSPGYWIRTAELSLKLSRVQDERQGAP